MRNMLVFSLHFWINQFSLNALLCTIALRSYQDSLLLYTVLSVGKGLKDLQIGNLNKSQNDVTISSTEHNFLFSHFFATTKDIL